MKLVNLTFLLAYTLILTSCAGMFQGRTFIEEMDRETDGLWIPGKDFRMTSGDTGRSFRTRQEIQRRTPKSYRDSEQSQYEASIQQELEQRLSKLDERDYINYTRYEDFLKSPSEKVYLLSLSPSQWEEYIETRAAHEDSDRNETQFTGRAPASVNSQDWTPIDDLHVGMDKNQVIDKWGRPHKIDYASDIDESSERWSFYSAGRIKHVFFDKGSVSSWSDE